MYIANGFKPIVNKTFRKTKCTINFTYSLIGNILFPEGDSPNIKVKLKENAPADLKIEINPELRMPEKQGDWSINYLNQSILFVPKLNNNEITLKQTPSTMKRLVNSDEKIEYRFYIPSGGDYLGTLKGHLLIYYNSPVPLTPSTDPDIYLFLPSSAICIAKLQAPKNAYPP